MEAGTTGRMMTCREKEQVDINERSERGVHLNITSHEHVLLI